MFFGSWKTALAFGGLLDSFSVSTNVELYIISFNSDFSFKVDSHVKFQDLIPCWGIASALPRRRGYPSVLSKQHQGDIITTQYLNLLISRDQSFVRGQSSRGNSKSAPDCNHFPIRSNTYRNTRRGNRNLARAHRQLEESACQPFIRTVIHCHSR